MQPCPSCETSSFPSLRFFMVMGSAKESEGERANPAATAAEVAKKSRRLRLRSEARLMRAAYGPGGDSALGFRLQPGEPRAPPVSDREHDGRRLREAAGRAERVTAS